MTSPSDWYREVPPITRILLTAWVVFATALQFPFIANLGFHKVLMWSILPFDGSTNPIWYPFKTRELWRIFTNFLFGGTFQPNPFGFIFKCLFLYRHGRPLESENYAGRYADFLTMLAFTMGASLLMLWPFPWMYTYTFGSDALIGIVVYLWSRNNPGTSVSVYGFFQVDIFYFPMVMLAISTVLSGSIPWPTLVGMLAGHLFWFLTVLHPRNRGTGSLIKTPGFMHHLAQFMGQEPRGRDAGYRFFAGRGNRFD